MTASPHALVAQGKIADVPIMIGDMRDEGTLFSLVNNLNTTTTAEFEDYYNRIWWPKANIAQMNQLAALYPQNPAAGSPYNTGLLNAITPQYKRIASLTGDYSFEAQRRQLLQLAPGKKWTYLTDNSVTGLAGVIDGVANIPILGSFHGSDALFYDYGTLPVPNSKNIMDTVISFVSTLDPNNHGTGIPRWFEWTPGQKEMYHFIESGPGVIIDDYREAGMAYINANADSLLI
jgi:acetylcholinesterase